MPRFERDYLQEISDAFISNHLGVLDHPSREKALANIAKAYGFASKHLTGMRKDKKTSEFSHSAEVALQAALDGHDSDRVVGYLLHDLTEDHGVKISTIKRMFGMRPASIVDKLSDPKLLMDESGTPVLEENQQLQWIFANDKRYYSLPSAPQEYRQARNEAKYERMTREGTADDWIGKIYDAWHNLKTIDALPEDRQYEYRLLFAEHIGPILERFDPDFLEKFAPLLKGVAINTNTLKPAEEPVLFFPERHKVVITHLPSAKSKSILVYLSEGNSCEIEVPKKYSPSDTMSMLKASLKPEEIAQSKSLLGMTMGRGAGHIFRASFTHTAFEELAGNLDRFHHYLIKSTPSPHAEKVLSSWTRRD